jgi:hypothetical protein
VYTAYATALFIAVACWEGWSLARSWLPLRTAALAAAAAAGQAAAGQAAAADAPGAAAGAAAAAASGGGIGGIGGMLFVAWATVILVAGSAICKLVTQVVENHGYALLASFSGCHDLLLLRPEQAGWACICYCRVGLPACMCLFLTAVAVIPASAG